MNNKSYKIADSSSTTFRQKVKSGAGFTLLEVLIYIVLFGMLMGGAVVAAYQLLEGGQRQGQAIVAQQEGTFLNRKLFWAISSATEVTVSGGNVLTITRDDLGAGSPLTIDGSGARITLARGAGSPLPLTSEGLLISDVLFEVVPPAGGLPKAVHVAFSINGKDFTYGMYLRQ